MKIEADIFNLTPHPITINDGTKKVTFEPMEVKELPRVNMVTTGEDEVDGIKIRKIKQSAITHLPEAEAESIYIVSAMVAQAAPHRSDLICPDTEQANRDGKGFIISVKGFVSYAHPTLVECNGCGSEDSPDKMAYHLLNEYYDNYYCHECMKNK